MRWSVVAVLFAACGSPAVESGVYEVTQGSGIPVGTKFIVSPGTATLGLGPYLQSAFPEVTLEGSGGDFSSDTFSWSHGSCDAGGACFYVEQRLTAEVPGEGLLHVDACMASTAKCTIDPNPTCTLAEAHNVLATAACVTTFDVDARRTGPVP